MLSSRSFVTLHFISVIHFEWSFVRGIRSVCGLVDRRGMVLIQNHLMKRLIALYVFTPWGNPAGCICVGLFLGTYVCL